MRKIALILVFLLGYHEGARAQSLNAPMPPPNFQPLDNNGNTIPGGSACVYQAGTSTPMNSYPTATSNSANQQPVVLDSSGRANIWLRAAAKIVLYAAGGSGCPNSAVQIWSVDGIPAITKDPTFNSVTSSTVFNSNADVNGGNAFQTSGGTVTITGSGNGNFQEINANHFSFPGFMSAPTPPGAGFAFMYYDTAIGALRYNLGGAGWVNVPAGVAGSSGQIQFNLTGAFGASSNFTWNNATQVMTVAGATTSGYNGPVFSSSNTGSNVAFTTAAGTFTITGAGNFNGQNFTAHSVFNSNADLFGGNAFQTSTGTMHITGAGAGLFQSVEVTTGFTANSQAGVTGASCSHFEGGICTSL